MPASKQVRIVWQIVFMFIPILNFWAFYRIKKLRRFFLYVVLPAIIIEIMIVVPLVLPNEFHEYSGMLIDRPDMIDPPPTLLPHMTPIEPQVEKATLLFQILLIIYEVGFNALAIYLVIIWSKKWNQQFSSLS